MLVIPLANPSKFRQDKTGNVGYPTRSGSLRPCLFDKGNQPPVESRSIGNWGNIESREPNQGYLDFFSSANIRPMRAIISRDFAWVFGMRFSQTFAGRFHAGCAFLFVHKVQILGLFPRTVMGRSAPNLRTATKLRQRKVFLTHN